MSDGRLVDLRSAGPRMVLEQWRRWEESTPPWVRSLEAWTGRRSASWIARRAAARTRPPLDRIIVSIGNLRIGGTGKTPVVRDIALRLGEQGRSGVILCRGYGSDRTAPCIVDLHDRACGDEARLLVRDTGWAVVQAADRKAGYRLAERITAPGDIILLEDGFQTAAVPRHYDLLIVDRWELAEGKLQPLAGWTLPWGPYRESAAAARRAAAVLVEITDTSVIPLETVFGQKVYSFVRHVELAPGSRPTGPYGIVCGLARPEGFEQSCERLCGHPPAVMVRFDDHAAYHGGDVARLRRLGEEHRLDAWLTTAKDGVKLKSVWSVATPLLEVGLELTWPGPHPTELWTGTTGA